MRVSASPEAVRFVQEHGGKVYVSAKRVRCCGGQRTFLKTATEPGERSFRAVGDAGIEVFLDDSLRDPDELEIAIQGRRNKRVEAYWNGLAEVM
jgi:hypothetical protein